jgi:hypothetical protein
MTPRCTCLDASIRRTCCYNFHHYAAHTCRRLTLFCAGTANSLLCTPAITWPPRQLLALLPHVSMFHLNNPYNSLQQHDRTHPLNRGAFCVLEKICLPVCLPLCRITFKSVHFMSSTLTILTELDRFRLISLMD